MTVLSLYLALATWLFASAWLLPHSIPTAWNSLVSALLIAAVALISFAAPGKPGLRFGNALMAVWLLIAALLMPHVSLATMAHDVVVAMLLSALVIFTSGRWRKLTPVDDATASR
jgi:hypothetical protein